MALALLFVGHYCSVHYSIAVFLDALIELMTMLSMIRLAVGYCKDEEVILVDDVVASETMIGQEFQHYIVFPTTTTILSMNQDLPLPDTILLLMILIELI